LLGFAVSSFGCKLAAVAEYTRWKNLPESEKGEPKSAPYSAFSPRSYLINADAGRETFPQGLKPSFAVLSMSELKLRPPKTIYEMGCSGKTCLKQRRIRITHLSRHRVKRRRVR
jgi:hypothetical protein